MRAVILACVLAGVPARAEVVVELPRSTVKLIVPDGWTAVRAPGVAAAYQAQTGETLAVTRADVPNPDAWKADKKQAYADLVERGVKARIPGYKRVARRFAEVHGVPTLDLEARRDGGAATVVVRVVLFRTYALALAIEVPRGGDLPGARAIAAQFAPPPPPPSR